MVLAEVIQELSLVFEINENYIVAYAWKTTKQKSIVEHNLYNKVENPWES